MKKLAFVLITIVLFISCNSEKPVPIVRLYGERQGHYKMLTAETDIPLDLDFDSIKGTNLLEEIPCWYQSSSYYFSVDIQTLEPYSFGAFMIDPVKPMLRDSILPYFCYNPEQLQYRGYSSGDSVIITYDKVEEGSTNNRFQNAHVKSIKWRNDTLYYRCSKQFYTPDGWVEANCVWTYVKDSDNF